MYKPNAVTLKAMVKTLQKHLEAERLGRSNDNFIKNQQIAQLKRELEDVYTEYQDACSRLDLPCEQCHYFGGDLDFRWKGKDND